MYICFNPQSTPLYSSQMRRHFGKSQNVCILKSPISPIEHFSLWASTSDTFRRDSYEDPSYLITAEVLLIFVMGSRHFGKRFVIV